MYWLGFGKCCFEVVVIVVIVVCVVGVELFGLMFWVWYVDLVCFVLYWGEVVYY